MSDHERVYLAVDLGASSGRVLAGLFNGKQLRLEEIHRFENGPVEAAGSMYWDLLAIWDQVQDGLRSAGVTYGSRVASVGVDTWGVDFGLLGRNDELLGNPYHYRDRRTQGILPTAFQTVPRADIFAATGLQFMEFNSLYQLLAMRRAGSSQLEVAESLLMIPDLFHWLMTGEKANEATNASTTQFLDPQTGQWATSLLNQFEIPTAMLGTIVAPGTRLGTLRPDVAQRTGLSGVDVVLPGTHDTASAVAAVPAAPGDPDRPDWCYISSGTWSLMGVEVSRPIINDTCSELNFTNEGGVGGTTRLLKNIAGLWLVQECRRVWRQAGHDYGWSELVRMAESAPPLVSLIDPDHTDFVAPAEMPAAIVNYCQRTGQRVPQNEGAIIRCALESLALRYRMVLGCLENLIGNSIATVHIVGGGTQNRLLCQMAADACNRTVLAGPVEATAIGNVIMQAVAAGDVASIDQARQCIAASFPPVRFEPQFAEPWDLAFDRFEQLIAR